MKTYLLNLWDAARASYWFVPTVFATAAVLLSFLLPQVDAAVNASGTDLPDSILTTTAAARATLSALVGAMVAVTGTVFSITIVTLSLTSQQFGPRLLRRFMYDLPTQMTLGVFLATAVYSLLLLRVVESRHDGPAAPHLSVIVAVVLGVLSMGMLIWFIHHVAVLIQAPHVVAAVADDLDRAIVRLYPEKIGEPPDDEEHQAEQAERQEGQLGDDPLVLHSTHEGYIQAIDGEGLMEMARKHDLVLRLIARPGDFIAADLPLAEVWPPSGSAASADSEDDESREDELKKRFNEAVLVGIRRTPRQDVECAIEELVEVAVRSLSPGVNDPFTAINCIDRLSASLGDLAERRIPSAYRHDSEGRLRIIARPVSFPAVLEAAFNQIRQYGRDSVAVTIRLLEALTSIARRARCERDRSAILHHGQMIAEQAESQPQEYDRREIAERHQRLKKVVVEGRGGIEL